MILHKNVDKYLEQGFPFSVIYKDDSFIINKKEYPLGYTSCLILNCNYAFAETMVFEEIKELVDSLIDSFGKETLSAYQFKLREAITLMGKYDLFQMLGWDSIHARLDSCFSEHMIRLYEDYNFIQRQDIVFDDLDRMDELVKASITYEVLLAFGLYLCRTNTQVDKYYALVFHLTREIMKNNARNSNQLAKSFQSFLNDDVMKSIHSYSSSSLRNETITAPVVVGGDGEEQILRKVYFKNVRDFLFTDLFEGLIHGHYSWRCEICDRYFFMTTAHRQLYCSTVNPEYHVPCSYVAKHPEITKRDMPKQSKKDSPCYVIWKKRADSIRKNKSLGKYDEAVSAEAKKYIDDCFETALIDFEYAETQYESDMEMANIYQKAMEMLDV